MKSKDEIVPTRTDAEIEKRKRVIDSDESHQPLKTRAMDNSTAFTSSSSGDMSEINIAPMDGQSSSKNPQGLVQRKTLTKTQRQRAFSLSALPPHLQRKPNVPVDDNTGLDIPPALKADLLKADQDRREIEEARDAVRLELVALQKVTDKKKQLAERKLQNDKESG